MDTHSYVNPIPKGQLNTFNLLLFLSHFMKSKGPLDACVLNFPRAKKRELIGINKTTNPQSFAFVSVVF
jgi:hypothetical protein